MAGVGGMIYFGCFGTLLLCAEWFRIDKWQLILIRDLSNSCWQK